MTASDQKRQIIPMVTTFAASAVVCIKSRSEAPIVSVCTKGGTMKFFLMPLGFFVASGVLFALRMPKLAVLAAVVAFGGLYEAFTHW